MAGSNNFSTQFIKITSHHKKIGYNIYELQQTTCLVINPITVGNLALIKIGYNIYELQQTTCLVVNPITVGNLALIVCWQVRLQTVPT